MPSSRRPLRGLGPKLPGEPAGRLVISYAVDPFDGDDVTVYHVEDPVPADAEPMVPAPVEPLRRIRVTANAATATPIARMPSWSRR